MLPESLIRLSKLSLADPMPLWHISHPTRRAAVSVILSSTSQNELQVLLTVRSRNLSYAGDVAFPGGKVNDAIESPWDAAARETREEVAIHPSTLTPVKILPAYVSSRILMVVPVVMWSERAPNTQQLANAEVYKVFNNPLSRFLAADGHHYERAKIKNGGEIKLSHFNIVPSNKKVGDPLYDRVWGLTANILIDCGRLILNRNPEFAFERGRNPNLRDATEFGNHSILQSLAARGVLQSRLPARRSAQLRPT